MKKDAPSTPISAQPAGSTLGAPARITPAPARPRPPLDATGRRAKATNGGKSTNGAKSISHRRAEQNETHSFAHAEQVLAGLIALKKGNFDARLPQSWTGIVGKVADIFNDVAEMMSHSTDELSRIS